MSLLHHSRLGFRAEIPRALEHSGRLRLIEGERFSSAVSQRFPLTSGQPVLQFERGELIAQQSCRVGVVFSGGPAPGGHNVVAGLLDALPAGSELRGFLGGPSGIVSGKYRSLTPDLVDRYRNTGGFDMFGTGRTKIETDDQLRAALRTTAELDGLVVIGGDDSNTNAAVMAEHFRRHGADTCVVGVPKTIDGDLKNDQIEISFGHDTACRVYSELIGNLARDAASTGKYYHFVRLMGRSASHITLECALQTQPNLALVGEEIAARRMTLSQVVDSLVEVVDKRQHQHGLFLIPEGIVEFIPEMQQLIAELNTLIARGEPVPESLSAGSRNCFTGLPADIRDQLLLDRDPHGNVHVSGIETERMLMNMVAERTGAKGVHHFFGYEGRSAMPTNFDATYCDSLGRVAAALIMARRTGYMAAVCDLHHPVADWRAAGVPLTQMMHLETRSGREKPVIRKALVDLKGAPFRRYQTMREAWAVADAYCYSGPIQFSDPTPQIPITLALEAAERDSR